jgi:hypothetical protein
MAGACAQAAAEGAALACLFAIRATLSGPSAAGFDMHIQNALVSTWRACTDGSEAETDLRVSRLSDTIRRHKSHKRGSPKRPGPPRYDALGLANVSGTEFIDGG